MGKTCFYCGKKVKFLDFDLQNGKLCDECFKKASKEDGNITPFNISKYSGEEICAIINHDEEALAHPENFAPHESKAEKLAKKGEKVSLATEKVISLIAILLAILLITNSGLIEQLFNWFAKEKLDVDGDAYIEMVCSAEPYDNTSYGEAFEAEFDRNEWSYFKSDDKRIVQVKSYYNNIDDEMITQFLLTPQGDDQFLIELYAISVSGYSLSNIEKNMVIAALFKGDLSQVLLESMLNDAFSN